MIMDNNEKAFESYTGTEVFQILLERKFQPVRIG